MGRQLQRWRSENDEKLWLSMLIDAMERVARREVRAVPCDRLVMAAVSAQLMRPASPHTHSPCMHSLYMHGASHFSLRN
jgi:truncated hemoglobin YjbI